MSPVDDRPSYRDVPTAPSVAADIFGPRLSVAEEYARLLASTGIGHGLIGPREAPRLWERHILNCAVIAPAFAQDGVVLDLGSGAGLPGVALAIARADLRVTLVEPLHRRATWLLSTMEELHLSNVSLHVGRAESLWGKGRSQYATARAVARLATLATWCLPLLEPGGSLLVLKGSSAEAELAADRRTIERLGGRRLRVESYGLGLVDPPTLAVRIDVDVAIPPPNARGNTRRRPRGRRGRRR